MESTWYEDGQGGDYDYQICCKEVIEMFLGVNETWEESRKEER